MSAAAIAAVAVATAPNTSGSLSASVWYLVAVLTLFPLISYIYGGDGSDFKREKHGGIAYLAFNFLVSLPVCIWLF